MNLTNKLQKVIERIHEAKTIAIFAHTNYDHDCLGSMYALGHFLKRLNKQVEMFVDGELSEIDARFYDKSLLSTTPKEYDLLISVDCADANRLGKYAAYFKDHSNTVRLDHHKGINYDTAFELTYGSYSSCCEVIMEFIEIMGKKVMAAEANYLYSGLISDTNNFTNSNVTSQTFKNAVKLIESGADNAEVAEQTTRTISYGAKMAECKMFERTQIFDKDVCISYLSLRDFKNAGISLNEFPGYASKLLEIDPINIACLIKQKSANVFCVSLRAKIGHDVRKIAEKIGGGGHPQAAGAMIEGNEKTIVEKIAQLIKENR